VLDLFLFNFVFESLFVVFFFHKVFLFKNTRNLIFNLLDFLFELVKVSFVVFSVRFRFLLLNLHCIKFFGVIIKKGLNLLNMVFCLIQSFL